MTSRSTILASLLALVLCRCTGDRDHSSAADASATANSASGGATGTSGSGGSSSTGGTSGSGGALGSGGSVSGPTAAAVDAAIAGDSGASTRDSGASAGNGSADAAVNDAGAGGGAYTASPIADPPSYMGTEGSDAACAKAYRTIGYAPLDTTDGKHPLFLYFAGTSGGSDDESSRYDCQAADRVNQAMARRGFVALSVEYDNALLSIFSDKLPCLFGTANANNLIAKACALPSVDCALGIATWGHSQGALLAHAAANYDDRVHAVWTTGYSGLTGAKLPVDRFRTVNGEADTMNSDVTTSNKTAGFTSADQCPDDGRDTCLRSDGSGWIIVRKNACKVTSADHCWFDKRSCAENAESLEPNWADASSNTPFALEANADWVATTVARP